MIAKRKNNITLIFLFLLCTDRDKINTIVRKNDNAGKGQFFSSYILQQKCVKHQLIACPQGFFHLFRLMY